MLNRTIFSDNGVLTDRTKEISNYHSDAVEFITTADEDYLYISSELPLNHLYFDITSAASTAMAITMESFDGTDFNDVVDTIDETNGLTQAGFITWTPNQDKGWGRDDTEDITSLSTIVIYDKYWIRMKIESSNTFSLNWIGNIFSTDDELGDKYPDLNRSDILTSFESGKTEWKEQHIVVARDIINKLKSRNTIIDRSQILVRQQLSEPAVHHLAEIIYNHFGDAYRDQRDDARKAYIDALIGVKLIADENQNALPDRTGSSGITSGKLYR